MKHKTEFLAWPTLDVGAKLPKWKLFNPKSLNSVKEQSRKKIDI